MTTVRPDQPDIDTLPGLPIPKSVPPQLELGRSGLRRASGYVEEEFLPQLRGRKAVQVYREMADNDSIVGALVFAIERLLRQLEWRVEPASSSADDKSNAEFVEQCMEDMSNSWGDMISEICSMVTYGWAYHEVVYKKRVGPWEANSKHRSKYTDGRLGWRKIALRSQETLLRWEFDETGGIQAMVQCSPPNYAMVVLPINKCLLFRTTTSKNNPEGYSLLRRAYQSWYYKKRIQEIEAVGIERDLAGMPVGKVPAEYLAALPGSKEAKMVDAYRKMVKSVRRDEQEGLILPLAYDPDTKLPIYDFELLTSGGTRQFDTEAVIGRYSQGILMQCLADFILVGHEDNGGSYALHTDKTGMFRTAINSLAQSIADVFNRHAIPKLFSLNGIKPAELPQLVPNDVDPPALDQLGAFMTSMAGVGMQWFPDPELEKFVRDAARLPKMDPKVEKILETEQRQAQIIALTQQRLQVIQLEQQAEQGEMANTQQRMELEQMQAAPPDGGDPGDPDGKQAQAQAGEATNQAKYGTQSAKVKVDQEKQKLANLKKPAPKSPPNKPIRKSLSGFGVDHRPAA